MKNIGYVPQPKLMILDKPESNLEKAFGVNVKIRDFYHGDKRFTCVLPISAAAEKEIAS